jgi:hypothetical protein
MENKDFSVSELLCACGCGKVTPIAPETRPNRGWVRGEPMPYFPHHSKNKFPGSDDTHKTCRKCHLRQQLSAFYKNRHTKDGFQPYCKACSKAATYSYRTTTGGLIRTVTARTKNALKKYSLTQDQYDAMMAAQNYVCAICHQPEQTKHKEVSRRLAVDHCHTTGAIRGLLCSHCNHGIGRFHDKIDLLKSAIDYLTLHNKRAA